VDSGRTLSLSREADRKTRQEEKSEGERSRVEKREVPVGLWISYPEEAMALMMSEMERTPTEDVTVRLEPSLGSLLACYTGSPLDRRETLAERDTLGDRARRAEEECRQLRGEVDELRSSRAWLLAELEARRPEEEDQGGPPPPPRDHGGEAPTARETRRLRADLDAATATVERLKRSEAHLKARLKASDDERTARDPEPKADDDFLHTRRSGFRRDDDDDDEATATRKKLSLEASEAAQAATQETLRLRRELLEAQATVSKLEKERDEARKEHKSKSSREAAADERVRALEKCLETMVQGNEEAQALRGQVETLRFERDEWLRHFPEIDSSKKSSKSSSSSSPTECARRALERLRRAEKEALELRVKLAEASAEAKGAAARADAAEEERAKIEAERTADARDVVALRKRRDLLEAMRKVDQREIESLRRLVDRANLDDDREKDDKATGAKTDDGLLAAADARKVCDEARAAVDALLTLEREKELASAASSSSSSNEKTTEKKEKKKVEEYRVVHLAENPLAVALRDKQVAKDTAAGGVDSSKLHARLKERFRLQLTWFREAVYLLTGFKIDMTSDRDEDDATTVRLRSMFAEHPDDALLFQWSKDGVQLLDTPFAAGLDDRLFASLRFCNSVPAFLATVQLDLFDKSTLMPSS